MRILFTLLCFVVFSQSAQAQGFDPLGQALSEFLFGAPSKCFLEDFDKEERGLEEHFAIISEYEKKEKYCKAAQQAIALQLQYPAHPRVKQFPERAIELLLLGEHWKPVIVEVHNYFIQRPEGVEAFKAEKMYWLMTKAYMGAMPSFQHDQTITMESLDAFEAFIEYFPDSPHVPQVKQFLFLARDTKARYEAIEVGGYYLKRGKRKKEARFFMAAYNRIKALFVIADFEGTTAEGEALDMLYESLAPLTFPIPKTSRDELRRCISDDEPRMVVGGIKKFVATNPKISNLKGKRVEKVQQKLAVIYDRLASNELCNGKKLLQEMFEVRTDLGNKWTKKSEVVFLNATFDRLRNVFLVKEFQDSAAAPEAMAYVVRVAAKLSQLVEEKAEKDEWTQKAQFGLETLRENYGRSEWLNYANKWVRNPKL